MATLGRHQRRWRYRLSYTTVVEPFADLILRGLAELAANAENDEAIRAQFLKKLDAVRKAIHDTRSEMLGDSDFLLGMEGLRLLVSQDLGGIADKNAGLNAKLAELLRTHKTNAKVWQGAEVAIQVGLLFIPGAGPFLSAMAGFALSANQMATAMCSKSVAPSRVRIASTPSGAQEPLLDHGYFFVPYPQPTPVPNCVGADWRSAVC